MVVLVVEDEAIIAYCAVAMLQEAGHSVLGSAHTVAEALKLHANAGQKWHWSISISKFPVRG